MSARMLAATSAARTKPTPTRPRARNWQSSCATAPFSQDAQGGRRQVRHSQDCAAESEEKPGTTGQAYAVRHLVRFHHQPAGRQGASPHVLVQHRHRPLPVRQPSRPAGRRLHPVLAGANWSVATSSWWNRARLDRGPRLERDHPHPALVRRQGPGPQAATPNGTRMSNEEYRRAKRKQVAERIDVIDTMLETPIGLIGSIPNRHDAVHDVIWPTTRCSAAFHDRCRWQPPRHQHRRTPALVEPAPRASSGSASFHRHLARRSGGAARLDRPARRTIRLTRPAPVLPVQAMRPAQVAGKRGRVAMPYH